MSPEIVFFPDGSGTTISISEFVKDIGVQTNIMFPLSAKCTKAANKARRLIFMIRRSFQDLSRLGFIPLYPHLEYGVPTCSPNLVADIDYLELIQRLVTGIRHLPYEVRLKRLGLHSLKRRRLRADLITAFKIFTGLIDIDPNFVFLPPTRRDLKGHLYKVLQGASHCQRREWAFSVRVVKYWNKLAASVVTAPSVNVFKKKLEKVLTGVFPHLPH